MEAKRFASFDLHRTIEGIAKLLRITPEQVRATVELLDAGSTIPFIARYRKEATGSLNEGVLRSIDDAIGQARELAARKMTILQTIDGQGLLTAELQRQIEACDDKRTLEELYLPFKPKRRTRATIARAGPATVGRSVVATRDPRDAAQRNRSAVCQCRPGGSG